MSGEYTQMAGRAGRRGLDPVGTVIVACRDDIPEEGEIRTLLTGRATKLESQFRLTYTMILNLLRVEDLKASLLLDNSFSTQVTSLTLRYLLEESLSEYGASAENLFFDCSY